MTIQHGHKSETMPSRVVILGAGFVGAATARRLNERGVDALALHRNDVDLLQSDATKRLSEILKPNDTLVFVSAEAPVKNEELLIRNLQMLVAVRDALLNVDLAQLVYVSSDAVYADSDSPLTENSSTAPDSLHGVMHLSREISLKAIAGETPFAIVRPTLIYGAGDPHNGYGPNQFNRLADKNEPIRLFGNGEERRDHVHVDDVGELIARIIMHKSVGELNITTGEVVSFRDIAEKVAEMSETEIEIKSSPRSGPMPHGGYRPFDSSATFEAFPDFQYKNIDAGLALYK